MNNTILYQWRKKYLSYGVSFMGVLLLMAGCADSPSVPVDYPSTSGTTSPTPPTSGTVVPGPGTMRPYQIKGKWYYPTEVAIGTQENGFASWYGPDYHGRTTSNGETYDMHAKTAAHKTFPMNTIVKVTNKNNNLSTVVRINDRGPFVEGRVIDLSNAAAKEVDMLKTGTAPVMLEVLGFHGVISSDSTASIPVVDSQEFPVGKIETSMSIGKLSVQIGAFRKKQGADQYQREHNNIGGYTAIVKEFQLDGAPIYRVMLSGFKSEAEARDFISGEPNLRGAFIVAD